MKKEKCCICGEPCSGKMLIEARRGVDYIFCKFHFNRYMLCSLKEIRLAIKKSKHLNSIKSY